MDPLRVQSLIRSFADVLERSQEAEHYPAVKIAAGPIHRPPLALDACDRAQKDAYRTLAHWLLFPPKEHPASRTESLDRAVTKYKETYSIETAQQNKELMLALDNLQERLVYLIGWFAAAPGERSYNRLVQHLEAGIIDAIWEDLNTPARYRCLPFDSERQQRLQIKEAVRQQSQILNIVHLLRHTERTWSTNNQDVGMAFLDIITEENPTSWNPELAGKHRVLSYYLVQSPTLPRKNKAQDYFAEASYAQKMGDLDKAKRCFLKAHHVAPDWFEPLNNAGIVYLQTGQLTKACDAFLTVYRKDTGPVKWMACTGIVYIAYEQHLRGASTVGREIENLLPVEYQQKGPLMTALFFCKESCRGGITPARISNLMATYLALGNERAAETLFWEVFDADRAECSQEDLVKALMRSSGGLREWFERFNDQLRKRR